MTSCGGAKDRRNHIAHLSYAAAACCSALFSGGAAVLSPDFSASIPVSRASEACFLGGEGRWAGNRSQCLQPSLTGF